MKLIFGLALCLLVTFTASAQADAGDCQVAITPIVVSKHIPSSASKALIDKVKQLCSLNGVNANIDNPLFALKVNVDVIDKSITATAPPMHSLILGITFTIVDLSNNSIYSVTSTQVKGAGQNETKAYAMAIESINLQKANFKQFMTQGRTKVEEFYFNQCEYVMQIARDLNSQGQKDEAVIILKAVPASCPNCHKSCIELANEFSK